MLTGIDVYGKGVPQSMTIGCSYTQKKTTACAL